MKKIFLFLLIATLLSACAPTQEAIATSMAVQIPPALAVALNAAILFGVTFALQWVFEKIKLDLRGLGTGLAVAVSEFLILQLQGWIDVVPAQYDIYVTLGLGILLSVLTTLGYIRVLLQPDRAAAMFTPNSPRLFKK